jgi:chromosome segregation ATPase
MIPITHEAHIPMGSSEGLKSKFNYKDQLITHTPNTLLEKQVKQLKAELEIRVSLINSMRLEINNLKKKQKSINEKKSADQIRVESLTSTLHTQNALISELRQGLTAQQAKILNTITINNLKEDNKKLETKLAAARREIASFKEVKSESNPKEFSLAKKKASELADVVANALDKSSPSIPVKEYLERTIHTMRKTTNISALEHFFIQAIDGFESRAEEIKSANAKTRK